MAVNYRVVRGNTPPASANPNTAAGQAQAILGPQLAQQDLYATHQNAAIRSFAQALLGKLQPVAGQVGSDYDKAIQQIGGLSGQAAQYFSGQNPAPLQQALMQSVGAPASQQAQSAQALGNTFGGGAGVLAFTGGVVPGAELAGDKAAAQASARQLPGIAALKGQQDLASALWKQSEDRATLEATRPGLVQTAQNQIDTRNYQNAQLGQAAARDREGAREFNVSEADKAAAAQQTANYRTQALNATNAYRQAQINQSQGRIDLGYAKVQQSAVDKAKDRAATTAYHDAYLTHLTAGDGERVAHDKALEAADSARVAVSQQNANTSAFNANTSRINARTSRIRAQTAASKPPAAPKLSTSASGRYGVQTDTSGNPILRNGKTVPYPKTGGAKPKTLTPGDAQTETARINRALITMTTGVDPVDQSKHTPLTDRGAAIAELRAEGYFSSPVLRRMALAILNKYYPPPVSPVGSPKNLFGTAGQAAATAATTR